MAFIGDIQEEKQLTVSNTAVGLSLTSSFSYVQIQVNDAVIRARFDGTTDPTSSLGWRYFPGDEIIIINERDAKNAKFIRESSTDANLEIQSFIE